MPTVSEPLWPLKDERTEVIVNDFLEGRDSQDVFRARLCGNGLRGDELTSVYHRAIWQVVEKNCGDALTTVFVMERDGTQTKLRFKSKEAAGQAVKLLRKQPNVLFANRI